MIYEMKLQNDPFNKIKNGIKTIEMRLYDEKRRKLKENDIIEFTNVLTNEKIRVQVLRLHLFNNFKELYEHFDKVSLGYNKDEVAQSSDMDIYYSKEEQQKYGVVGIEIKLKNT